MTFLLPSAPSPSISYNYIPFKTAAYINYNTKIRVMTDPEPQYIKKNPKDGTGKKKDGN